MKRKFLVGGNWKMNGNVQLIDAMVNKTLSGLPESLREETEIVITPPFPYLALLKDALSKLKQEGMIWVGAQNVHHQLQGAFTGEVSVAMLEDLGVHWTLIGHSERRRLYGEGDGLVGEKLQTILQSTKTINVIVCVGETLEQRQQDQTEATLKAQLDALLPTPSTSQSELAIEWSHRVSIAYEPVWAIGTGVVATSAQAQAAHNFIRKWIATHLGTSAANQVRIIYGGSVTGTNCHELALQPDVDGFLVGGASLKPEFRTIALSSSSSSIPKADN